MSRQPNIALDRSQIVQAAFEILEAEGLDGLSMRALGARLNVKAPALYWHVAGKDELLGMMAAVIQRQARAAIPPVAGWRDWLLAFGRELRRAYAGHRDAARLCASAKPIDPPAAAAEIVAAPLVALGLSVDDALSLQASVISLTIGWAVFEENGPMHAFLAEMMDCEASFERGLQALVSGYRLAD